MTISGPVYSPLPSQPRATNYWDASYAVRINCSFKPEV